MNRAREGLHVLQDMRASHGDARDLTPPQEQAMRACFEDSTGLGLWSFAVYICGFDKLTTELHWEMCSFLSKWGEPGWRRLMMMVPRGSFKTSLGSIALPLWLASRDPESTIGIFNASAEQAKSWIGAIRNVIEASRLYQRLWAHVLPPGVKYDDKRSVPRSWKWGDTGILFVRSAKAVPELTMEPYGIGGSSTGKHYTHRIMDDLIGETAANSPTLIEDAIHFVDHARSLERPPQGGCELVNCTPWAYRDCYSHMLTKWPEDYRVYRRSLLEHPETGLPDLIEGESIFPENISTEKARKMYEADPFTFASQYQTIPMAGRETSFDRKWLREVTIEERNEGEPCIRIRAEDYDPLRVHSDISGQRAPDLVPLHWCDRAILLDPAPTKKGEKSNEPRARNGLVAIALDPWGRLFTLESIALREDPVTIMEYVVLLAKRWKAHKVGIEEVNFSRVYAPLWSVILKQKYPRLQISFLPLKPKGEDKDTRINATRPRHREGLWYYNMVDCRYIIQELLEYPNGETRDLIDAQAYWHQALSRPLTPDEREQQFYQESGRDAATGY